LEKLFGVVKEASVSLGDDRVLMLVAYGTQPATAKPVDCPVG
jgi:hypothetical protein